MFFDEWLYYGFLTILVQLIIFLSAKLAWSYYKDWQINKDPELKKLLIELDGVLTDLETLDKEHGELFIAYLIYPTSETLTTNNCLVVPTLSRAEKEVREGESIIQVMSAFPNQHDNFRPQLPHVGPWHL